MCRVRTKKFKKLFHPSVHSDDELLATSWEGTSEGFTANPQGWGTSGHPWNGESVNTWCCQINSYTRCLMLQHQNWKHSWTFHECPRLFNRPRFSSWIPRFDTNWAQRHGRGSILGGSRQTSPCSVCGHRVTELFPLLCYFGMLVILCILYT